MNDKGFFKKELCRICQSSDIKKVVELTPTPPGNNFILEDELDSPEQLFPLDLYFCNQCFHTQLGHVVDPELLFRNDYTYVSSTSAVFVKHLSDYADYAVETLALKKSSLVIDIGSNDGTCLKFFKNLGMNVLGVDPATQISEIANNNGIKTISDFFSSSLAESIIKNYGKADLITSHNACAHIDDLDGVISGASSLLKDEGTFIMEVGYFVDVFENRWFDTIYHEHVDFHTVQPLKKLFARFNMEIYKVERISPQGGSIRVFVQNKNGKKNIHQSVEDLVNLENELGLNNINTYKEFENEINNVRDRFQKLIKEIKSDGSNIAAFGAPTKATTLCYHFEIDRNQIDFIVDDNPLKQGYYSPGKHIPVFDSSFIYSEKPDYLVILAWNFAESIMLKHQSFLKSGGAFILPMPEPKIIKKNMISHK
jgi:SAM-dependent methyltransferase